MKEFELPTKDIKTGAKVVGALASKTFERVKPIVKREFSQFLYKMLTRGSNKTK